ncbi:MAG: hypothetical protein ABFD92_21015 [Planctomycetaceae bacterium]
MTKAKWSTVALWGVYVALLLVLLPHTAWAFSLFEPKTTFGQVVGWFAAVSFEFAILVLTHKLARHLETVPNRGDAKRKFQRRYLNAYAAGLAVAISVSAFANVAHAVEFGGKMAIFAGWPWGFVVYVAAFGGILPLTSLLFARVLSNVADTEQETDPEVLDLRAKLKEAKETLTEAGRKVQEIERRAQKAETELAITGRLFTGDKRDRIVAALETWPALPSSAVAIITRSSASYVSEVVNGNGHERVQVQEAQE